MKAMLFVQVDYCYASYLGWVQLIEILDLNTFELTRFVVYVYSHGNKKNITRKTYTGKCLNKG